MNGPGLTILGIQIDEFSTTLSDILVSLFCLYAALALRRLSGQQPGKSLFVWHFFVLAAATFLGGVMGHGFLYILGMEGKIPGWTLSILSVFLLDLALLRILGHHVMPWMQLAWLIFLSFVSMLCLTLSVLRLEFIWVEVQALIGVLIFIGINGWKLRRNAVLQNVFSQFFLGIGMAVVAALVFLFTVSPGRWFNHLDLSHVFLGLSAWYFYRGAAKYLGAKH